MVEKKKTSIIIDPKLWKELQHKAIDKDKDISELLEEAIQDYIKKK